MKPHRGIFQCLCHNRYENPFPYTNDVQGIKFQHLLSRFGEVKRQRARKLPSNLSEVHYFFMQTCRSTQQRSMGPFEVELSIKNCF